MKKALIALLAFAFLAISPVLAVANDNIASPVHSDGMPQLKMTDDQKAKMISLKTQILELKKQIIKQNLNDGTITKEQAQKMEAKIDARLQELKSGNLSPSHRNHSRKGQHE